MSGDERDGTPGGPGDREHPDLPDLPEGESFDLDALDEEFAREFGPKPPKAAVLVVPATNARKLAEVCTLADVHAWVVPVRGLGCALVAQDPATGERDAEALSTVLRGAELVLLLRGEESIDGQTWRDGQRGEDPRAGLLLSVWPDTVQRLVLGSLDPAEAGGVAGGDGSKAGAFWKLFKGRREG
ncbi:hypothetical protein [Kineococcus sp. SYSU DK004]|uniref:hypothetical protein n=1 Tax=Kineococcus sp. SYSU DK004 TaxID=3383125 RepID=UPI003D7ED624